MSPSDHRRKPAADDLAVNVSPALAQINLRGASADLAGRLDRAGLPLAPRTNALLRRGSWTSLGLGPDEWLLLGPPDDVQRVLKRLTGLLADCHASIVDVSDQWQALDLEGAVQDELLAALSPLDLSLLADGRCAQTLMAKASVILFRRDEQAAVRVLVRSSYARYLEAAIRDQATLMQPSA